MFAASKSAGAAAGGGGTSDASFAYVPLLLETTSTDGQNNQGTTTTNGFLDSGTANGGVGFTITRGGSTTQGSVTPYWSNGQWSNYFSSSYLSVADSASLRFGAANFTIEAWVFRTASGATHTIAAKGAATPTGWVFQISSADKLVFIDTSTSITGATSLAANTWYYVAVVRAGTGSNQTTLYVNGTSDGTGTSATTFSQTDAMRIGTDRSAANGFVGYVSNLRLSNTNLTISSTPTTPLTALGSTIFLSCGYNRFVDGSSLASAITVGSGTPTVQAFQPFSPAAAYTPAAYAGSGYFNGSSDYLTAPANSAWAFGTGDFTIEFWQYHNSIANFQTIISQGYVGGATVGGWLVQTGNGDGKINFYYQAPAGTLIAAETGTTVVTGTWYHIAIVKNSSTLTIYRNGVSVGSGSDTRNYSASQILSTGGGSITGFNNFWVNGYISNLRIVKGTAIVPPAGGPTAPVTNVTNTSLLLNFTNAGIYDATTQNVVSTVGDAQVSNTITAQWPPTSMKFDGSGDYLTMPANLTGTFGSGNWTIEFWQYYSSLTGYQTIISQGYVGFVTGGWAVQTGLSDGKINFYYQTAVPALIAAETGTTVVTGTWYYIAIVKSGSTTTIYRNGTNVGSGSDTRNYSSNNVVGVGGGSSTGFDNFWFNGYIQDLRITKGVARTITTPTAAFPTR